MKTRSLIIVISAALLIAGGITAIFVLQSAERLVIRSPMLSQQPSIVTYMEGIVEVSSGEDGNWIPAEIGMRIREGYLIRTGQDAIADIRIYDEGMIRLLGETQISLDELTLRHQSVNLSFGTLYAKFRLLFDSQDLRFNTPNAVAAVRGTELVFYVDDKGTRIDALSGITEVSNPAFPEQRILLASQQSTAVISGNSPEDPWELHYLSAMDHRREFNGINKEEVFLVSQDIHFQANTATILADSVDALDDVALKLNLRREKILIAGHTADVGASSGQVSLSEERAQAIRTELISRGISARRLSTIGYGGSRPVGDNSTAEGRATNRRVEFLVIE